MEKRPTNHSKQSKDALIRLKNAMDAYQNAAPTRTISAMNLQVWFAPIVGRVEHHKIGEEHVFTITRAFRDRLSRAFRDGRIGAEGDKNTLNVSAVRDEFLKVKDWSEALLFLETTGLFSPIGEVLTWSEFQTWQRFAYFVQEHDGLVRATRNCDWRGERGDVLADLSGMCLTSNFFDGPPLPATKDPKVTQRAQTIRGLCAWFRSPPPAAYSIQWFPVRANEEQTAVWRKLSENEADMLQFLLPQPATRPYLLIRARCTLQAIAAAIYVDRIHGVEYRACEMCKALFKVGAHKEKKYCDRELCKNRAHQRNRRANAKKRMPGKARKGREQ